MRKRGILSRKGGGPNYDLNSEFIVLVNIFKVSGKNCKESMMGALID